MRAAGRGLTRGVHERATLVAYNVMISRQVQHNTESHCAVSSWAEI